MRRARDRRNLGLLAAAWILLTIFTLWWAVPRIQDDLAGEARSELDNESLLGVSADFSGRDAQLVGIVGEQSEIDQAVAIVERIRGVRAVTENVVIDTEDPAEAAPTTTVETALALPNLSVIPTAAGIVLEGTVPSQVTAAAINATAAAAYGRVVDDRLIFDPSVRESAWTTDVTALINGVGGIGGTLTISDGLLTIGGVVADETTRTQLVNDLIALDLGLEIENRIELDPVIGLALFAIDAQPGGVVLRGTVDSEDRVERLIAAGEQIYGVGGVKSALVVDETITPASYVITPDEMFQSLEGRRLDLIVTEEGVYLRGIVPSEEDSESILDSVAKLVSPTPVINELTVVEADPATIAAVAAINEIIGTSLTFESASSEITTEAAGRLDEVAAILIARPELRGVVEGHTDDVGSAVDNLELSEARARSVVDYLIEAGVDSQRLTSIGFGESRPIASNSTAEGQAANRRIEFQVEGSV